MSVCVRVCVCANCRRLSAFVSVCACLYCIPYIGSPLTQPSAIMCMAVCRPCPGARGGISPRAGLIGVKQASVKSHQRLEMLSETGSLLLGDFLRLQDFSVSPSVSLSLPISLPLKISHRCSASICSPFLSHSLSAGFKHLLFITRPLPSPSMLAPSRWYCFLCLMSVLE